MIVVVLVHCWKAIVGTQVSRPKYPFLILEVQKKNKCQKYLWIKNGKNLVASYDSGNAGARISAPLHLRQTEAVIK